MNANVTTTATPGVNPANAAATGAPPGVREQLAQLLRAKVARGASYPLAPAQLSMWFHQSLEQDSTSYNMPFAFCLHGAPLEPANVQRALASVVERHAVLRTVFEMEHDEVVQRVRPLPAIALPMTELPGGHAPGWEHEVVARSKALSVQAFDLTVGPPYRFELLRVAADLHVLLATFHHIVMDGWSVGVFLGDFANAYAAWSRTGAAPQWPALPVSYGDYARQRQQASRGPDAARHVDYWRQRLQAPPVALSLPADYARPQVQTFNGAIHALALAPRVKTQLADVARQGGATFFMVSLTAFYVLLARLSGQWDMVLGVASANRDQPEHRGMLGLFSEILPMRAAIDAGASFMTVLEQVRQDCLSDYEHAAPPLAELAETMQRTRDARRSNLFQVGFDYQNTPWPEHLGQLVSLLHGDTGAAKLDLNLNLSSDPSGLLAQFEYNTDLFTADTMARFAQCFETLLASIVRDPHLPVAALAIVPAAPAPLPVAPAAASEDGARHVLQLIEASVLARPDAVALVDGDAALTYERLLARAHALAWRLTARGARSGARVGLCCERSSDLVVGLLAILHAGCAYVPMDAGMPLARLNDIAADAALDLVVVSGALMASLHGLAGVELVAEGDAADETPAGAPDVAICGTDLAYVLYTSGTTGRPKGVMVSHAALLNFAVPALRRLALEPGDKVLQFASIGFDASVEEIFPCLAAGATLVMREGGMVASVDAFLAMCERHGVTVLDLPTAYWHELTDALAAPDAPRLPACVRLVVIGGEAASPRMLARWQASVGAGVRLQNTYGPTETTVCVTTAELAELAFDPATCAGLPIGHANPGVDIYVLDERGVALPAGVYGEIYIGGATVADGYWARPELTAQKFVADPFSARPHARMFRTGDYGRVMADGSLQFGGRKDSQVKLRGYRVELAEVEAIVGGHPQVHQVCADIREGASEGDRSLVAFVVPVPNAAGLTPAALRRWLAERSPDFLVPSAIAIVDKFPLGLTGKTDRQALLAVLDAEQSRAPEQTRAASPTEELVIGIWQGVLGAGTLGVQDNFFERGGHSLLMIKMLSRVRRQLDVDVALAQVFEYPTVARFAAHVDALRRAGQPAVPPIPRLPRGAGATVLSVEQSFSQQRLWFHEKLNPASSAYHVPVVMTAHGAIDRAILARSLEALVARHEILRTTFADIDGKPVQRVAAARPCPLSYTDLGAVAAPERDAALEKLTSALIDTPFDLTAGPLLRAALVRLDDDEHVLALVFHHIVVDDWSMRILLAELRERYTALLAGRAPDASAPALQYADYAAWQRGAAMMALADEQLAQWTRELAGVPDLLALPLDRPRPAVQSHRGEVRAWTLAPELAGRLRAVATAQGVTLHMLLLSAWSLVLSKLSGQHDVVVGVPVANRHHDALENMLGFFVNTLPLRVRLAPNASLKALLAQVKQSSLAAYARQGVPLERIVETVRPQRDLGFNPLFVSMFSLQSGGGQPLALGDLRLAPREVDYRQAKVDVSLTVTDGGDAMTAELEYASDLFDAATIARWAGFVDHVLAQFTADLELPLSRATLQDADALAALLARVNAAGGAPMAKGGLHALFTVQAVARPEAVAVVDGDARYSYRELDRRSSQIAHALRQRGVRPDDIVALLVPRGVDMVAGMLGILKSGGAYLPLDTKLPAQRMAYMLADSGAVAALVDADGRSRLPAFGGQVLCLDTDAADIGVQPVTPPAAQDRDCGHDLAYVIYTSGSTGEPKGVMIEHGAAATQIEAVRERLRLNADDRLLQFASSSFDVSVQEIFSAFSAGAALVLRDADCLTSAQAFWAFCERQRTTVIDLPTRFWHELNFDALARCPSVVRAVNIGGEAVEESGLRRWFEGGGRRPALYNFYGPTETTINATLRELSADPATWQTIGKPFGAGVAYILDGQGQPAPAGVVGQLYIGGVGVARGYLNRPELTAERFVPDTVAGVGRMYATGDLAMWREDGEIVFLGRNDAQIKLRGFRIDLGEIEQCLHRLEVVRSALVLARANGAGEKRLVAYVTLKKELAGAPPLARRELVDTMMRDLRAQLPEYMVPSGILVLAELPVNASGKVDVNALPEMDWVVPAGEVLEPGTPTELALAEIWAGLLGQPVASVGLSSNFFELGGHSLLSMRLASEIRGTFGVEIPIRDIFGFGRLVELANRIELLQHGLQAPVRAEGAAVAEMGWL